MEKQFVAIAVFLLACSLPAIIASSVPSFDIHKLSLQFGKQFNPLDYYKLALEWPMSVCNTGGAKQCQTPIKYNFTIHSLRPYYRPDDRVSPFEESHCNFITPLPAEIITPLYLSGHGILYDMIQLWPNLFGYNDMEKNSEFWRRQWSEAGMCSLYPQDPASYFNIALRRIKEIDLWKILVSSGIVPNDDKYEAQAFANAIEKELGARVQIRCNKDANNTTQFYEVLLCINPFSEDIESCLETKYYGCSATEEIQFPSAGWFVGET